MQEICPHLWIFLDFQNVASNINYLICDANTYFRNNKENQAFTVGRDQSKEGSRRVQNCSVRVNTGYELWAINL